MSEEILSKGKCVRCGKPNKNGGKGGRCSSCLKKLASDKKKPGHWQRAQTKADDALRRQDGKNGTASKKSSGRGSRKEIVKQHQSAEKRSGEKLSPDRKDNNKGYSSKNVRSIPEKLNRGRHNADEKKLAEWRKGKKMKKSLLEKLDDVETLLKNKDPNGKPYGKDNPHPDAGKVGYSKNYKTETSNASDFSSKRRKAIEAMRSAKKAVPKSTNEKEKDRINAGREAISNKWKHEDSVDAVKADPNRGKKIEAEKAIKDREKKAYNPAAKNKKRDAKANPGVKAGTEKARAKAVQDHYDKQKNKSLKTNFSDEQKKKIAADLKAREQAKADRGKITDKGDAHAAKKKEEGYKNLERTRGKEYADKKRKEDADNQSRADAYRERIQEKQKIRKKNSQEIRDNAKRTLDIKQARREQAEKPNKIIRRRKKEDVKKSLDELRYDLLLAKSQLNPDSLSTEEKLDMAEILLKNIGE